MNGFVINKGRRLCEGDEVEMAGRIARRTTNVLHWIPREKKRPRRRPNARWVDKIKHFSRGIWMRIAAHRDMWRGLNMMMMMIHKLIN